MPSILHPLRDRSLRRFFAAWGGSSVGTGAGYVAILLVAQQRAGGGWAVGGVLLAQSLPAMLLGSALGRMVDRRSPATSAAAADVVGAIAFGALAFAASVPALLAFAALAGLGSALAGPSHMTLLPRLAGRDGLPGATALYGLLDEGGFVLGPLAAGAIIAVAAPRFALLLDAATFALSAAALATLRARAAAPLPADDSDARLAAAGATRGSSVRIVRRLPGIGAVLVASTLAVMSVGLANVGLILVATGALHVGGTGLSLLIAAMSTGMTLGALTRARAERPYRRRYVTGLAAMACGLFATAIAGALPVALAAMLVYGWGNASALTHERMLLQHIVPGSVKGAVFGLRRSLFAWSYCAAYGLAGPLGTVGGGRALLAAAGGAGLAAAAWGAATVLRPPPERRVAADVAVSGGLPA